LPSGPEKMSEEDRLLDQMTLHWLEGTEPVPPLRWYERQGWRNVGELLLYGGIWVAWLKINSYSEVLGWIGLLLMWAGIIFRTKWPKTRSDCIDAAKFFLFTVTLYALIILCLKFGW
jgi:hypothetical protein